MFRSILAIFRELYLTLYSVLRLLIVMNYTQTLLISRGKRSQNVNSSIGALQPPKHVRIKQGCNFNRYKCA
jgi:hypothetical protein